MKFLSHVSEGMHVMPLNYIYHNERDYTQDDAIDIVYKIIETDDVCIETIERPDIECWIVKPEYRQVYSTPRDYIKEEYLDKVRVRYRNRYKELAKILNIDPSAVRACPWVLQSNIDIKTFYAIQFQLEYGNDLEKKLNIGVFDIESDTINLDRFPKIAECPTNLISYVDVNGKIAWLFVLKPSGPARKIDPTTGRPYDNRDQVQYLQDHQADFIAECHADFDDGFGPDIEYQLVFFDDEMEMTKQFFSLLELSGIDIAMAWNDPYDMGCLLGRPEALCRDPKEICCSKRFKYKAATFQADDNPVAHKRKHNCHFSHPTTFVDMLVLYAGMKSGGPKVPSLKLNAVAKAELKDEKLDYSEDGNIRVAPYRNFWRFCKYSLKDSLLLYALHKKRNDIGDIYQRCYAGGLQYNEAFTTTVMLTNQITTDFMVDGLIVGNNRNKFRSSDIASFNMSQISDDDEDISEADLMEMIADEAENPTQSDAVKKKKKKNFVGAHVQNPNRQLATGFKINGVTIAKIHEHLIDEDVTSLYPSLFIIQNLSNETMIGRIIIPCDMKDYFKRIGNTKYEFREDGTLIGDGEEKEKAELEYTFGRFKFDGYDFIDNEEENYKINVSDTFAMMVAGKHWTELGENFFNLPSFSGVESTLLEMDPKILGVA